VNWDEVCGAREDVDSAKLIHLVVDVLGWFLCGPLGFQPSSLTTNFAILKLLLACELLLHERHEKVSPPCFILGLAELKQNKQVPSRMNQPRF
jgi:hypothetical protein